MYKELIQKLSQGNEWVKIQPPCPESEIKYAEMAVGHPFPKELKELLRETNGDKWCILSAKEMIENVEHNRKCYFPLFQEDYSKEEYSEKLTGLFSSPQTDAAIIIAIAFSPMKRWTKPQSIFGNMKS